MFVYGICIGTEKKYDSFAHPGLQKYAAGSPVILRRGQTSIFTAYNSILDEVEGMGEDVEGLVLLHEDVELTESIEETLSLELADESVAVVGAIGGKGVRSVRWSRSEETYGYAPDTFYGLNDHGRGAHDVDMVDGLLLALSPWAIKNLRFDASTFSGFHAYDADISMQARSRGKRVRVAELGLMHHTKGGFGDVKTHRDADDVFRKKWGIPRDSFAYRLRKRIKNLEY
ncbi:glycosyltransferase family protein [Arthrobacter sp. zg-Y826]|uniref:glycosyltransferase n=1 Tax=Arthrobacter jinronghuae TaxID=2964609 RepID=UPI002103A9B6|nr:glycosyltransferase [Arthrobacter jinronghuae]MCQ1957271.1 glycosyltransferase family protein [Arthrobacter jinronghuae]